MCKECGCIILQDAQTYVLSQWPTFKIKGLPTKKIAVDWGGLLVAVVYSYSGAACDAAYGGRRKISTCL